jgi:hypothetical protein
VWRFNDLYFGDHSKLDTCSYEIFFLTMTEILASQNIRIFSRITLYISHLYNSTLQHLWCEKYIT